MATSLAAIFFPPVSPLRFTEPDKVLPAAYNTRHFDDFALAESLLPFQDNPNYACKVQADDETWLQFHHNLYDFEVQIVDVDGALIASSASSPSPIFKTSNDFAGNVYDSNGTIAPIPLHTGVAKIPWGSLSLTDNRIYFVRILFFYNTAKTTYTERQSEPILYKTKHYRTFRLDYANATNEFGMFWAFQHPTSLLVKWNITFQLRLDGYLEQFEPDGNDVFYENQMTDLRQLSARPFRKQTLFVGDGYGISDYHIDRIWRALACSYTLVDGKRFTKEENAKLEITRKDQEPIKLAAIQLREYFSADAGFVNSSYTPLEAPAPGGYDPVGPASRPVLLLRTGGELPLGELRTVADSTEASTYADDLTAIISADGAYPLGLYGSFVYDVGIGLYYAPSADDEFDAVFRFDSWNTIIQHTIANTTQEGGDYFFKFSGGSFYVDWGDGSSGEYISYTGSGLQTVAHMYAEGSGSFTMKVYHNQAGIDAFAFASVNGFVITAVDDHFPSSLKSISIAGADFGGSFDLALLEHAASSLQSVTIKNSGISALDASTFDSGQWTAGLKLFDISGNALDGPALDSIVNALASKPALSMNGTLNISGQSPEAYPSEASEESRTALAAYKWNVIADASPQ